MNHFFEALFAAMDVDDSVGLSEMPLANPSLDPRLLPVQARVNRELDAESAKKVYNIMCETVPKEGSTPMDLFSDDQAQALRWRYEESNEALFRRFMPEFDGTPYQSR